MGLWAISVDSAERNGEFAASLFQGGVGAPNFPLLSDPLHRVIDAYRLRDSRYARLQRDGIPYPAVYVIDKRGRIAWSRVEKDYTQRPTNREIRAALDAVNP